MRTPSSETIVVKPELIRLVRRMDSKKWQVHYKLDGIKTWFRQSTDTADVKAAAAIAERNDLNSLTRYHRSRVIHLLRVMHDAVVKLTKFRPGKTC